MKRLHVFITGDVVGVGFRAFIKHHALKLGLKGWVRNVDEPVPGVEAVFEGTGDKLIEIVDICHRGPEVSWVEDVVTTYKNPTGEFDDFTIIR